MIMNYKIIDVEGIGEVYSQKLIAVGINTVEDLLEKCAKPAGRKALAEETGISGKLILTWTNHADLMRINGIGPQFSELLEAAGVDTVKELKHQARGNQRAEEPGEPRAQPLRGAAHDRASQGAARQDGVLTRAR